MIDEKVQSLINNGYEFRTGDYIREGWDLFKKNVGGFLLYLFIYLIISIIISVIPYAGQLIGIIVAMPLVFGFYIVADKIKYGEILGFNDFFKGFSKVVPFFIATVLIYTICLLLPGIYLVFLAHGIPDTQQLIPVFQADPSKIGILFLLLIPGIYFGICYVFAPFFIYFKNYSPWYALEASRKIISKKWLSFLGFYFLFLLIIILGFICLIIGLLVAIPVTYCAQYAAFNDIVGTREKSAEINIADHLI